MADEEIKRMVERLREIADPVARWVALQEFNARLLAARSEVAVMRTEVVRELRAVRDEAHPDGWSWGEIAALGGIARGNAQYIARGHGLGRAADAQEPDVP